MKEFFRILNRFWLSDFVVSRSAIQIYAVSGGLAYVAWAWIFLAINPHFNDSFWQRAVLI